MNFIRISEASSLAEKNVDLDQSRALYKEGENRICVCVLGGKGRWGSGRGSYTRKSSFSSASANPRNQRRAVAEFGPPFGETTL